MQMMTCSPLPFLSITVLSLLSKFCAVLVGNLLIFLSFLHLMYTAQLIADQAHLYIQCLILYSLILLVLPSSHWKSWLCSICFCSSQWKGTTNDTPVGMKTRFQSEIRHLPSPYKNQCYQPMKRLKVFGIFFKFHHFKAFSNLDSSSFNINM